MFTPCVPHAKAKAPRDVMLTTSKGSILLTIALKSRKGKVAIFLMGSSLPHTVNMELEVEWVQCKVLFIRLAFTGPPQRLGFRGQAGASNVNVSLGTLFTH